MTSTSNWTVAPTALSVVVAAQDARAGFAQCLQALECQRPDGITQVILVSDSTDGTADDVRRQFPTVEVVERNGPALVPDLWGDGILRCREEIIALTTAQMVPDPGWARALLQAYAGQSWAGVGGVILPTQGLCQVDQAVYWVRYSRFAAQAVAGVVRDIPGDNASYARRQLLAVTKRLHREGFWENEAHAQMRQQDTALYLTPEAIVRFQGGASLSRFARQRLAHGRRFGAHRVAQRSGGRRLLLLAAWPLSPAAFLARICWNAARAGRSGSLIKVLPLVLCLLICWSWGELLGYLFGAPDKGIAAASNTA